jgi:threonine/homoserine efflux transporter RhtA
VRTYLKRGDLVAKYLSRSLVPAALAVSGFWLWRAAEDPVQVVAALVLALAAVVGVLWYSHVQRGRRWRTALDAYAERSLAQERLNRRGAGLEGGRLARA